MTVKKKRFNPFYILLVATGIAFCVTACAFVIMMLNGSEPSRAIQERNRHGLLALMDVHGVTLLTGEIAVLALATAAAMGTDRFWDSKET